MHTDKDSAVHRGFTGLAGPAMLPGGPWAPLPSDGNKPDLETFAERGRDAQHCQRATLIVGILQAADYRSGSSDLPCQRPLAQARLGAEVIDHGRYLGIEKRLIVGAVQRRIARDKAVVGVLQRLRFEPSFRRHCAILPSAGRRCAAAGWK